MRPRPRPHWGDPQSVIRPLHVHGRGVRDERPPAGDFGGTDDRVEALPAELLSTRRALGARCGRGPPGTPGLLARSASEAHRLPRRWAAQRPAARVPQWSSPMRLGSSPRSGRGRSAAIRSRRDRLTRASGHARSPAGPSHSRRLSDHAMYSTRRLTPPTGARRPAPGVRCRPSVAGRSGRWRSGPCPAGTRRSPRRRRGG